MDLEKNFQEVEEEELKTSVLNKVTPLSKYLAMILFIAMPFIGGWIGYKYAPEKVVEVEKIVIKEVQVEGQALETNPTNTDDWQTYRDEDMGISFKYPNYLKIGNKTENLFSLKYSKELCDDDFCLSATPITFLKKPNTDFNYYLKNTHTYSFREATFEIEPIDGREARRGDVGDMITHTVIMIDHPSKNTVLEVVKDQTYIYHVTNDNNLGIQQDFEEIISTLEFIN